MAAATATTARIATRKKVLLVIDLQRAFFHGSSILHPSKTLSPETLYAPVAALTRQFRAEDTGSVPHRVVWITSRYTHHTAAAAAPGAAPSAKSPLPEAAVEGDTAPGDAVGATAAASEGAPADRHPTHRGAWNDDEARMEPMFETLVDSAKDQFVVKTAFNAFAETDLAAVVGPPEETELWISGVMTHVCVQHTIQAARELGYPVTVVADAVGTYQWKLQLRSLQAFSVLGCQVASLSSVVKPNTKVPLPFLAAGDCFIVYHAFPDHARIAREINKEVDWGRFTMQGGPVPRLVTTQGTILRTRGGRKGTVWANSGAKGDPWEQLVVRDDGAATDDASAAAAVPSSTSAASGSPLRAADACFWQPSEEDGMWEPLYRHPVDDVLPTYQWTPQCSRTRAVVGMVTGVNVNHALIQQYRYAKSLISDDNISEHSDKVLDMRGGVDATSGQWVSTPVCNANFGMTRSMEFSEKKPSGSDASHHRDPAAAEPASDLRRTGAGAVWMPPGSVFCMGPMSNRCWKHMVRKASDAEQTRALLYCSLHPAHLPTVDAAEKLVLECGRISLTMRDIATWKRRSDGFIVGQGAPKPDPLDPFRIPLATQRLWMLQSFSSDNRMRDDFDYRRQYKHGFACLSTRNQAILYWINGSIGSMRVMCMMRLLNAPALEYRLRIMRKYSETYTKYFTRLNPRHECPLVVFPQGVIMNESLAIMQMLDAPDWKELYLNTDARVNRTSVNQGAAVAASTAGATTPPPPPASVAAAAAAAAPDTAAAAPATHVVAEDPKYFTPWRGTVGGSTALRFVSIGDLPTLAVRATATAWLHESNNLTDAILEPLEELAFKAEVAAVAGSPEERHAEQEHAQLLRYAGAEMALWDGRLRAAAERSASTQTATGDAAAASPGTAVPAVFTCLFSPNAFCATDVALFVAVNYCWRRGMDLHPFPHMTAFYEALLHVEPLANGLPPGWPKKRGGSNIFDWARGVAPIWARRRALAATSAATAAAAVVAGDASTGSEDEG